LIFVDPANSFIVYPDPVDLAVLQTPSWRIGSFSR